MNIEYFKARKKKTLLFSALIIFVVFLLYQLYILFLTPNDNLNSIYLIPKDAVIILESQEPIDTWDKISQSDVWRHLQKNDYFNNLTGGLNKIDTLFHDKKGFFEFIGNRSLHISIHIHKKKDYGIFYVIDLKKTSKLNIIKNHFDTFFNKDYSVTKRKFNNQDIIEIYDKNSRKTLYVSFIKNQLIASYVHTLVENSITQLNQPVIGRDFNFIEINKKIGFDDMFRVYIQYDFLDDYMSYFLDKPNKTVENLSKNFMFSGFSIDYDNEDLIVANGFTNINQNGFNYLRELHNSGKGNRSIFEIAPKSTAFYLSLSFENYQTFYKNFKEVQKKNPEHFKDVIDNSKEIENLLKINLDKNIISWIDDEIALFQIKSSIPNHKNEIAIAIKSNDIEKATSNLKFLVNQVKKRTPLKFKELNYKDHKINFLSIKGVFKVLFGNIFDKIDKPYFTTIEDYVIFSDNPNTLRLIITNYLSKNTLSNSEEFIKFNNNFDDKSCVFGYINSELLYDNFYEIADNKTKLSIQKNKDFIVCFSQIGFQFIPSSENIFENKLIVQYRNPDKKQKTTFPKAIYPKPINPSDTIVEDGNDAIVEVDYNTLFIIEEIFPENLNDREYKVYYKSGEIHKVFSLKNGMKHGVYKEYYKNGNTKIKGRYRKDKQVGAWKAYFIDEELLFKKDF